MRRILITGALGHIGSRFIHGIKRGEYGEVIIIDDLSTQRYCSLFNLPEGVIFRFIEDDICTAALEDYFKGVDVVIHMAALTNAEASSDKKDLTFKVNYDATARVARACAACGSRLIFLSTTSVYGSQEAVVDEDCAPDGLKPQSPYAESKLKAENLIKDLGKEEALEYTICRFGTIFGTSAGMRFHTAINKFIWQACSGKPITVWRTALNQRRPYLDLGDAVRAIKFITEKEIFDNQIYNVLTLNATVAEIIEAIKEFVPDINIEHVDSRIMNQLSYVVSSGKFESLGFSFKGDLKRGVEETVKLIGRMRRYHAAE